MEKHGAEFPDLFNAKQYVEKAKSYLNNSEGILTKIRPNGEILKYHLESNIFTAFLKNGLPKTMFRPVELFEFWLKNELL